MTYSVMPVPTTLAAIPQAQHERFPNPPLKVMLGQVRFPTILLIEESRFIAEFQDSIRADFPDLSPEQQLGLEVTAEGAIESEAAKQWRFRSSDGAWSVVLATDFLTLEATPAQYSGYNDFRQRFVFVWERFTRSVKPSRVVQQGLRYVNHIAKDIPMMQWSEYISEELLGPFASARFASQIETAFSDMRLGRDDGTLAVKHGRVPAGPKQELGYILDYDYFIQELDSEGNIGELVTRFDTYHEAIYGLFVWSLTERALAEFRQVARTEKQ